MNSPLAQESSVLTFDWAPIKVRNHRSALDTNGLRYLMPMRSFFLSQSHQQALACDGLHRQHGHRLRYREIVWAFHSESQEILLQDSVAACPSKKFTWLTSRALGTFLWIKSRESLVCRTHPEP